MVDRLRIGLHWSWPELAEQLAESRRRWSAGAHDLVETAWSACDARERQLLVRVLRYFAQTEHRSAAGARAAEERPRYDGDGRGRGRR